MFATPEEILAHSSELYSSQDIALALQRMADEISARLAKENPLVLCVMKGAVLFAGQLLPLLNFPLDFDYLHATRYHDQTHGGTLEWKVFPQQAIVGRHVLVLDDILDQGHTMLAIRSRCMAEGAACFSSAVLLDKVLSDQSKPIAADFIGMQIPDRYVFGYGMDIKGFWRNLPAIYCMPDDESSLS